MPSDPMDALAGAIKANDVPAARAVLDENPDLRSKLNDAMPGGAFGATPLLAAVHRRNRQMIDVLLRAGADINARSHWWAGSFGVLDGDHGLAPFLIERGAMVNAYAAARLGMLDKLRELVAANPEVVHERGGDGQTPLHVAANVDVARFLLDRGADIDARDIDHESTPAQYAVRDRPAVARFLVERGCRADVLLLAALGDVERVRRHLDANPDSIRTSVCEQYFPKQDPRSGGTIYIWTLGGNKTAHLVAREFGHEEVLRLLMERTPAELKLALACELGDAAAMQSWLASRPGLARTLSSEDQRRIANAAQNNNAPAVRLMLAAGWPVDARGQHGGTPLHWAAWHGNAEMVREILRYHPPIEIRSRDFDATPLGWALHGSLNSWHRQAGDYGATVEALLDAGAKPPQSTGDVEANEAVREVLRRRGYGER